MTRSLCKIRIILLSLALISGCSTMQARVQDVSITTDPSGIRATIEDQSCITPCTLTNVGRAAEYVMFEQGAYRQQYVLDKKYNNGAMATVEFIGLKIIVPAFVMTEAAYEILPIDVKFSGSAENPLKAASPVGSTSGLREVAPEPELESEQISSTMEGRVPLCVDSRSFL